MSHPRFSIIPAGAVTDGTLEPRDLQVLCLLGRHTDKAGWCSRSQVKMAQEISCSRGSVQNSLDRLATAGWIEMKRRDIEVEEAGKRPSRSYAYRVLLDRDDFAFESISSIRDEDDADSHAENASDEGGCQPVGTIEDPEGVPTEQHPGANACVSTPAKPYDGTKNVPLERPPLERERDARARDRRSRFLVDFEARWPTAASDNRQRTAYAAGELTEDEETAALAGIAPFLENQKRLGRKNVPAGWRYLEERRWTLLEAAKETAGSTSASLPADSPEGKAILQLYAVARSRPFVNKGRIVYPGAITPQIMAFSQIPERSEWFWTGDFRQIKSWSEFIAAHVFGARPQLVTEKGIEVPWPWPPSTEGKIYATGPPPAELSEQDIADFK